MLKRIWNWLGTPTAARWFSGTAAVAIFIATLGATGSYWQAFKGLVQVWGIWMLGRMTIEHDEWQPIETAPTDGTEFLGYRNGRVATASRVPRTDCEMWVFGGVSAAVEYFPHIKPTHWRPALKRPRDSGEPGHGK